MMLMSLRCLPVALTVAIVRRAVVTIVRVVVILPVEGYLLARQIEVA